MAPYSRLSPHPPQTQSLCRSLGLGALEHPQEANRPSRHALDTWTATPAAAIACTKALSRLAAMRKTYLIYNKNIILKIWNISYIYKPRMWGMLQQFAQMPSFCAFKIVHHQFQSTHACRAIKIYCTAPPN